VVTSLSVHVLAASVWIGGLMALILMLRGSTRVLPSALPRFSHVALLCFMSIGLSGLVDVWIRLATLDQLWTTEYGRLVLAKTGALVVLGGFGWWHRRRTIPAVRDGCPGAFLRLAAAEVVVMLAAIGLAVALSRTPPPPDPGHGTTTVVPAAALSS